MSGRAARRTRCRACRQRAACGHALPDPGPQRMRRRGRPITFPFPRFHCGAPSAPRTRIG
ncbi:hypothetical protein CFB39_00745 [Burkholderia sp. AU6039]|nr:hypothetical protein CFB39_00745 [Burkholderia sp. AU6039]